MAKYTAAELQDNSKSAVDGIILFTLWLAVFFLTGYYESVLLAVLCGLMLYPIVGVAHDFLHMKDHPLRFLWLITGFTHREWQKMHCIDHHLEAESLH
jgi:hypothetical protein